MPIRFSGSCDLFALFVSVEMPCSGGSQVQRPTAAESCGSGEQWHTAVDSQEE